MSNDAAELSSLATALTDLTRRLTTIAERRGGGQEPDEIGVRLFEVERSLRDAQRRLERVVSEVR